MTPEQELFRETTAKFLEDRVPVDELRRRRDDPAGFDREYWRQGAELGWTSLLVSEALGGGTISGDGPLDLTLIAHEFGRHAAPGPLVGTNIVAAALSEANVHADVLSELLSGASTASWAFAEPRPNDRLGAVALDIRVEGQDVVLNGAKRPVESAAQVDYLLVSGRTGSSLSQVLVPTDAKGLSIQPLRSLDLTRRFAAVTFENVRVPLGSLIGALGEADDAVQHQLHLALLVVNAEAVGTMQAGFDMTVAWAFDRYSFGRPLASYQALKHRFADMKCWLEAGHAVSDAAAVAVSSASPEACELVSVAKAFVGDYGAELLHECVQLHGGIGITFEHDVHLYLRRHAVTRGLYGTPAEHLQRITDAWEQRERAA